MSVATSPIAANTTLSSREAGRLCGVSFRTVIRWVERGELRAFRLPGRGDYRIALAELQDFARRNGLPEPRIPRPASNKVLVVDDDRAMANAIRRVLHQAGFETQIAADGFQAGSLLHSFAPALMTLDLRMPGLDGVGVLRFLQEAAPLPSLKVLVISGESEERLREACQLGAHAALAKPFKSEQLLYAVRQLLGKAET
ncbi:MAG: response regulator [Paucibacter sp.]|nr:response regulator [Roseateles sp.]